MKTESIHFAQKLKALYNYLNYSYPKRRKRYLKYVPLEFDFLSYITEKKRTKNKVSLNYLQHMLINETQMR